MDMPQRFAASSLLKASLVKIVSIGLASILAVMLVAQLYSFDVFIIILIDIFDSSFYGILFGVLVVLFELLSLPVLLGMTRSLFLRRVSILSLVATIFLWLFMTVFTIMNSHSIEGVAYFGDVLTISPGMLSVVFMAILSILSAWAFLGALRSEKYS